MSPGKGYSEPELQGRLRTGPEIGWDVNTAHGISGVAAQEAGPPHVCHRDGHHQPLSMSSPQVQAKPWWVELWQVVRPEN